MRLSRRADASHQRPSSGRSALSPPFSRRGSDSRGRRRLAGPSSGASCCFRSAPWARSISLDVAYGFGLALSLACNATAVVATYLLGRALGLRARVSVLGAGLFALLAGHLASRGRGRQSKRHLADRSGAFPIHGAALDSPRAGDTRPDSSRLDQWRGGCPDRCFAGTCDSRPSVKCPDRRLRARLPRPPARACPFRRRRDSGL